MKLLNCIFLFAAAFAFPFVSTAVTADNCAHKVWTWKVDRKAARELQQSVDQGHQPWRLDESAVAAEAINGRKQEWADYDTVLGVPQQVSQTSDSAVLVAKSQNGHTRYEVSLRKYPRLLGPTQNDLRRLIWLPASVERVECDSGRQ
jgi:hypothetical protein